MLPILVMTLSLKSYFIKARKLSENKERLQNILYKNFENSIFIKALRFLLTKQGSYLDK